MDRWNSQPYHACHVFLSDHHPSRWSCSPRVKSRRCRFPNSWSMLDWKRPRCHFDRNMHISNSDSWRILCGHFCGFDSHLFPRRRYHLSIFDLVLHSFCPHVFQCLFLGFFQGFSVMAHTFCPLPLIQCCPACFQFPCLSWSGSSCLGGQKRSNLRTPSLPSQ